MTRIGHCMLRVADLNRSLKFYVEILGMSLLRRDDYPEGRFTLAFVGYGNAIESAMLELTHNWDTTCYQHGNGFGHLALNVDCVVTTCAQLAEAGVTIMRPPGPMRHRTSDGKNTDIIAFIEDPDGYPIELVEHAADGY